jgi:hypothetical protein
LAPWQIIETILLSVVVLDLALGGNGYLISIGPFRIREILYVLCLGWVALRLTTGQQVRLEPKIWALFGFFLAVTAFGAALGYFNGSRVEAILAELKPLAYFPMFLFFLVAIRTRGALELFVSILIGSGGSARITVFAAALERQDRPHRILGHFQFSTCQR